MRYLILFLLSFPAFAGSIQLSWVAPVEREDNSPLSLSEIESYKIYYNTDGSTAYPNMISVTDPTATTYTMDLPPATYNIVMTVLAGSESVFSDVVIKTIPLVKPPPKPVTGLDALVLP